MGKSLASLNLHERQILQIQWEACEGIIQGVRASMAGQNLVIFFVASIAAGVTQYRCSPFESS